MHWLPRTAEQALHRALLLKTWLHTADLGGGAGVTVVLCTERLISKKRGALFSGVSENTLKGKSVLKGVAMVPWSPVV